MRGCIGETSEPLFNSTPVAVFYILYIHGNPSYHLFPDGMHLSFTAHIFCATHSLSVLGSQPGGLLTSSIAFPKEWYVSIDWYTFSFLFLPFSFSCSISRWSSCRHKCDAEQIMGGGEHSSSGGRSKKPKPLLTRRTYRSYIPAADFKNCLFQRKRYAVYGSTPEPSTYTFPVTVDNLDISGETENVIDRSSPLRGG